MIASREGNCMSERLGGGRRDLLFTAYTFLNFINVHVLSKPKKEIFKICLNTLDYAKLK